LKRGWVPALSEPSFASTNEDFTTGLFDAPKHRNVNDMGGVASQRAYGHDGYGSSGMGSGVGDRRKWDEGAVNESENAMEAGEFPALCAHLVSLWSSSLFCFHLSRTLDLFYRCLCDPLLRQVKSPERTGS